MIAFDIISGEYLTGSDSLEYIDRQRSALSEKKNYHYSHLALLPPRRLSPANNLPVRALLKTATSISFYVTLISNAIIAMVCRIKAEWGQGYHRYLRVRLLLKGRLASALTALRSTPCASTAAAAAAARAVSTFSPGDDDGRAKSDLAKIWRYR